MTSLDVLFVVRSLGIGGAERQLVLLARGLHRRGRRVGVVQFYPGGPLEEGLRADGIALFSLDKRGRWDIVGFLSRFRLLLHATHPQVCHGYLPVPNLLTLFARVWSPGTRVVWGVRDAGVEPGFYDRLTHLSFWLTRWLARFADLIIANSTGGGERHASMGYPAEKLHVIPNGIDTEHFAPNHADPNSLRIRLGLPVGVPLVGCVARMDPLKGIDVLLVAVATARSRGWSGQLMVVGGGSDVVAKALRRSVTELGLDQVVHWREREVDLPAFYSAIDALCLTSRSEGFPNVLAEAMACGTPCIASDVGDVAAVLGGKGTLVSPDDPEGVARALEQVPGSRSVGSAAEQRRQIVAHFGVDALITKSETLLFGSERE